MSTTREDIAVGIIKDLKAAEERGDPHRFAPDQLTRPQAIRFWEFIRDAERDKTKPA